MQGWRHKIQGRKSGIIGVGVVLCILLGLLFYRTVIGSVVLLPFLPLFVKYVDKRIKEAAERELKREFKDALLSISSGMQAGMSVETALSGSIATMTQMYGIDSAIVHSLLSIDNSLKCNDTIEHAFTELGSETGIDVIKDFAEVLVTAKRTGGNLISAISNAAACMDMQQEVQRDIETMLAGKQYEARLMNIMPLGIIVYLRVGLPHIAAKLYGTITGAVIMTIALAAYIAAFVWTEKITGEVVRH